MFYNEQGRDVLVLNVERYSGSQVRFTVPNSAISNAPCESINAGLRNISTDCILYDRMCSESTLIATSAE